MPTNKIIHSTHRARKAYTCSECGCTIEVGQKYLLEQEQINHGYWHKRKFCSQCLIVKTVNLEVTQHHRPNKPIGGEWWIVEIEGERSVIQLTESYRKDWGYYEMGSDVTMYNTSSDEWNSQRVKFIRKVHIDD